MPPASCLPERLQCCASRHMPQLCRTPLWGDSKSMKTLETGLEYAYCHLDSGPCATTPLIVVFSKVKNIGGKVIKHHPSENSQLGCITAVHILIALNRELQLFTSDCSCFTASAASADAPYLAIVLAPSCTSTTAHKVYYFVLLLESLIKGI